jgi:hypothetical protein
VLGIQFPQFRDHFFGKAVTEEFLIGVVTEILEWQHRQRHPARRGRRQRLEIQPRDR